MISLGAVGAWAGWNYLDLIDAGRYVAAKGIKGVWAYDTLDPVAGPAPGPWKNYSVTAGDPLDVQETPLWLTQNPTPYLLEAAV